MIPDKCKTEILLNAIIVKPVAVAATGGGVLVYFLVVF
jgi:hypothetical protein